jgi:hypothetical protein
MLNDEGLEQGTEIRPGVMAGPWEKDRCKHGRWYVFRWEWPVGSTIESSEPNVGRNGCKKCREED